MGRCRFVPPEVVRLPLSDGDWIDVKKELNAGETRRIFTDLVRDLRAGEPATLDPRQVGLTKMINYIVGWSLVDDQGRPAPFSPTTIDNLDPETYREIHDAVETHDAAVEKMRVDRKNVRAGETASSPISPFVAT